MEKGRPDGDVLVSESQVGENIPTSSHRDGQGRHRVGVDTFNCFPREDGALEPRRIEGVTPTSLDRIATGAFTVALNVGDPVWQVS